MPPPEREREAGRGCGLAAGRRGLCSRPARRGLAVKIRDAHLQDLGQVQKNEAACGIKKPDSDLRHRVCCLLGRQERAGAAEAERPRSAS